MGDLRWVLEVITWDPIYHNDPKKDRDRELTTDENVLHPTVEGRSWFYYFPLSSFRGRKK